ncbi:MAG: cob(I)yrinic acid a,c-diamide adenosyltransferase [Ardenticatenaceae bacterium]|nr:cob(I)yrinic acid a,c-diamide adenosyltransferase [Ardenticatenaceae bacterium]HBY98575.1 cob(I)yrinic acid a,c-diamide adenosyltransferase [Chloroflexota bacterium]
MSEPAPTGRPGLLLVNTGDGKGKSTAALGLALRAAGHGLRVVMLQFMKDPDTWHVGEWLAAEHLPSLTIEALGEGFTWEHETLEIDIAAARHAWERCRAVLSDPSVDVAIIDELNYVIDYGFLDIDEVLPSILSRPRHQHVVVTGRNAHPRLVEAADTVTEMRKIKHAFDEGVPAIKGIEF